MTSEISAAIVSGPTMENISDDAATRERREYGAGGIIAGLAHFANSFRPSRISCAVSAFSPALREADAIAAAACG